MPCGDSWLKVENVATDKVAMKNSVAMPIRGTSNCGNPQLSESMFARQLAGEENKSNFSKTNLCDKRRRKFLVDHENSRRNKLKQEATSEIIKELLNLSQFEVSEKEHLSRVLLQVDLIAENRSNRDQLIASECELNVERQNIWKDVVIAREIGWVVKHRILAQLDSFNDLEKSRKAASDNRSVLVSNSTLLRIRQLNNWVKSCNSLGLFPPSEEITQDFLASATCDTTEIISNLNEMKIPAEEDHVLSNAYSMSLSDARVMYLSPLLIPKPLPKVEDLHLFEDLPYTISEHLSQVDVKWLLSEVLETQDMMPAADPSTYSTSTEEFQFKDRSLEGIWSRKVSFAKNSDLLLPGTPPLTSLLETTVPATIGFERVKDLWGSDHRYAIAEHLAVHDLDRYILDIGNALLEGDYDRPPCSSIPPAADTPIVTSSTQQQKRRGSVVVGEVEVVCSDPMNMVLAPSWLLTTPSKHLLGAVIVAVRCAAAVTASPTTTATSGHDSNLEVMNVEVCDDASAVATLTDADFIISDVELGGPRSIATAMTQVQYSPCILNSSKSVPVFSVRLALCGASDLAKKAVSNAVSALSEGSVRIIRVDRLLSQAVDSARVSASDSTKSYLTVSSEGSCEGDDKQSLGLRALNILLKGQCIPDDVYVSLVIHAIYDLDAERRERASYSASDGTAAQGDAVTGFILEDFPNTKQQASLLVIALSGVDYDTHKPQPADHASRFAPIAPYEMLVHDSALCGLDRVLYLDATLEASLSERLSARMNTATNALVFLSPGGDGSHAHYSHMTSHMSHGDTGGYTSSPLQLRNLEEINDSLSSRHTSSLDIALTSSTGEKLREFLTKIGVLSQLHSSAYTCRDEYIDAAVKMLYQPVERALDSDRHRSNIVTNSDYELYGTIDTCRGEGERVGQGEGVGDGVEEGNETAKVSQTATIECVRTNGSDSVSSAQPVPTPAYTSLPIQLATALTGMWNTAENTSIEVGRVFFKSLRDYRYQMVQRRRVMHDALRLLQVRLDNRQDLFEDFIVGFNQIDDDFRFDPDCVAELLLRSLELREAILLGCDMRKRDADSFVLTASLDGIPQLLVHMSECEGVAMVQAEYNRFIVSIHLLLDYSKSMASYDCTKKILNVLEETLQASVLDDSSTSSIAAKDGRKSNTTSSTGTGTSISGGGGSTVGTVKKMQPVRKGSHNQTSLEPEVYRVPVPVISLPFGAMSEHPRSVSVADAVDDDARTVTTKSHRGKLDAKQSRIRPSSSATTRDEKANKASSGANQSTGSVTGTGTVPVPGVFQLMESAVLDLVQSWSRECFKIHNVLYDKDRSLCAALEAGVWHECERFRRSIGIIKSILAKQSAWLTDTEVTLQLVLEKKISERYEKECSAAERLIGMIEERIESAQSIRHQWLLAPDVIAVVKNVLLTASEPSTIIPSITKCDDDELNEIQYKALEKWINSVSLGGFVLEEDLHSLLDRGLNVIGPFGTKTLHSDGVLEHLTFPKKWRDLEPSNSTSNSHSNSHSKSSKQLIVNTDKSLTHFEGIRKYVVKREKINGINEYSGMMSVDNILKILRGKLSLL